VQVVRLHTRDVAALLLLGLRGALVPVSMPARLSGWELLSAELFEP
jgi:hypothetical protein